MGTSEGDGACSGLLTSDGEHSIRGVLQKTIGDGDGSTTWAVVDDESMAPSRRQRAAVVSGVTVGDDSCARGAALTLAGLDSKEESSVINLMGLQSSKGSKPLFIVDIRPCRLLPPLVRYCFKSSGR